MSSVSICVVFKMWLCDCWSLTSSPCGTASSRVDGRECRWPWDCVNSSRRNGDFCSPSSGYESCRSANSSEHFFSLWRCVIPSLNAELEVSLPFMPLALNLEEKACSWEWKTFNSRGKTGKQLIITPKIISACVQKPIRIKLCVISSDRTNLKVKYVRTMEMMQVLFEKELVIDRSFYSRRKGDKIKCVNTYSNPVAKTAKTPSFFLSGTCNFQIDRTGSIKRAKSEKTLKNPVPSIEESQL